MQLKLFSNVTRPRLMAWLSLAFLAAALALPYGVSGWFDGLPLTRKAEALTLGLALPFLCAFGFGFLKRPVGPLFCAILLAVKVLLCLAAPAEGLLVKAYDNPARLAWEQWERGYESLWHSEASAVLDRPFHRVRDFPLEWINRYNNKALRGDTRPVMEISGWVTLPKGAGLVIVASGTTHQEAWAHAARGKARVPLAASRQTAARFRPPLAPGGAFRLSALLFYQSPFEPGWGLDFLAVWPDGRTAPLFKKGALWQSRRAAELAGQAPWSLLARAFDLGFAAFLAVWGLFTLGSLREEGLLAPPVLAAAFLGLTLPPVLNWAGAWPLMSQVRGVALAGALLALAAACSGPRLPAWQGRPGRAVLLALSPGILAPFALKWLGEAAAWSFFPVGHDMLTYQNFARAIVLQGDWTQAATAPAFTYQPLYRYLVALVHLLGGQSVFFMRILDIWAVAGAASLLAGLGKRLGLSAAYCFAGAALFLTHMLGDRFLFLLGIGLQETLAMFLMLAVARLAAGPASTSGAGAMATGAQLLRQDHLSGLGAAWFLRLEPLTGGAARAWGLLWHRLAAHWRGAALYWGFLAAAVLAVCWRNWHYGGHFGLISQSNLGYLATMSWQRATDSLYLVLSGDPRQVLACGLTLWAGFLASLAGLFFRWGPFKAFPLSLALLLPAILAPYALVWANAYHPRFSTHLLPFAVLAVMCAAQALAAWPPLARLLGTRPAQERSPANIEADGF